MNITDKNKCRGGSVLIVYNGGGQVLLVFKMLRVIGQQVYDITTRAPRIRR